jgi:pSer/pThr/pTyr-binding forkhead associated (FHA) protein
MPMRFLATVAEGTLAGACQDVVLAGEKILLGREEQADLVLPDLTVSRRHALIRSSAAGWTVEDLGSRLGTLLNGKPLTVKHAVPLKAGDELEIGVFRVIAAEADVGVACDARVAAWRLARQLNAKRGFGDPCAYLRIENGPAVGFRYPLRENARLRIGRGRECEISIDDARVSRVHAILYQEEGDMWLVDADSSNGTFLNGRPITQPVMLCDGCRIQIGRIGLLLVDPFQRQMGWSAVMDTDPPGHSLFAPSVLLAGMFAAAGMLMLLWL